MSAPAPPQLVNPENPEAVTADAKDFSQTPGSPSPRVQPFRSSFLSWVPTDEKQLYDCEAIINAPLYKLGFEQYHVAGLNTLTLRASTTSFDGSTLKEEQTKEFHEKFVKKNSWFGGSSCSSSNSKLPSGSAMRTQYLARNQPILVKQKEQQQQSSSAATSSSKAHTAKVPIEYHHVVFGHGFAGGNCNWLPNLIALGKIVNEKNQDRLEKAIKNAVAAAVESTSTTSPDNNDDNNNNNNSSSSSSMSPVKITILHAFDLPGFARSKRDENLSFSDAAGVLRYYCWSFDEWFKAADITPDSSNVEKWLRMDDLLEHQGKKYPTVDIQFVPPTDKKIKNEVTFNAHSFGAFLGSHFAIRYPHRVQHLVLTDPFGVPQYDKDNKNHQLSSSAINWKFRAVAKLMLNVCESALTPALRLLGPWAPDFISKMRPDFLERWEGLVEDPKIIMDYIYHCNAPKANVGDHAMAKTIQPETRAIAQLPLAPVVPTQLHPSIKLSIVYGKNSWMDQQAGVKMFDDRKVFLEKQETEELRNNLGLFEFIDHAGHQVNSDQPEKYNEYLKKILYL